jgi:hypothetical protein
MIDLDPVLAELATLRSGGEPIVSVYLDVRWGDEQQRERVRVSLHARARALLAHYPPGTPDGPALARTLVRVQAWVEELAGHDLAAGSSGAALFACGGLGLWRTFRLGIPFQEELGADAIPHLGQLARVAARSRPAVVVVPSLDGAVVFEVRLGEIDAEATVRGPAPRSDQEVTNAGTGQPRRVTEREAKDDRQVDAWARRNRQAAARQVTALFDAAPGARLLLVGTAESTAAFARELPERAAAAVAARVPLPRAWGSSGGIRRNGVRALVKEVLGDGTDGEPERVKAIVGEALRGGLAVAGPEDVVLAANEGRIHLLFAEDDLAQSGFRCEDCGALGHDVEAAEVCPYCQGELHAMLSLKEALVARTLASGGRVELVRRDGRLHAFRGVAALLRQTAPTGLRGASPPWPTAPGASPG